MSTSFRIKNLITSHVIVIETEFHYSPNTIASRRDAVFIRVVNAEYFQIYTIATEILVISISSRLQSNSS